MINGKVFDWESKEIFLNGVKLAEIVDINYKDSKEVEKIRGAGSGVLGYGGGNLDGSGDMTLERGEYDRINNAARAAGKSIYDFVPMTIVVSHGAKVSPEGSDFVDIQHGATHTETLLNVVFSSRDTGAKQNDKSNEMKLGFEFEPPIR